MEKEKRNQTASFLMVVGIIFIVIAGTIFASTVWKYLPAGGKQCILFLISLGLFAGAGKAAKDGFMEKTETALFYLAASFLGLFVMSVCGGIIEKGGIMGSEWILSPVTGWNEEAVMLGGAAMFLPVLARFIKKRRAFDFTCMALLADWVIFWFEVSKDAGWFSGCVLSAAGLTAYTAADCLRRKWMGDSRHVEQAFTVLYIIHVVTFVFRNLTLFLIEDILLLKAGLFTMAAFMVCITVLLCVSRKKRIFTVLNSMAVYWMAITGVIFTNELFFDGTKYMWNNEMVHFIIFTLCAVCMAAFARVEMIWVTAVWGVLIPFFQIFGYGDYNLLFSHVCHRISIYVPFSGVLAAAMAVVLIRKLCEGKLDREEAKQYGMAVGMQVIVTGIMFYASRYPFLEKGIWSMLTVQCLAVSFLFRNTTGKMLFKTFALMSGQVLAYICTNTLIPIDYYVEWGCLIWAAGVFMVRVIWENNSRGMRTLQFICICVIMSVMLINAMCNSLSGVGNALILGITGVGMLVIASIVNSRRYEVLSSVTLVVLVFYLTRSFWFSIAWWVYLFAAGVALVFLAIKKEKASKEK